MGNVMIVMTWVPSISRKWSINSLPGACALQNEGDRRAEEDIMSRIIRLLAALVISLMGLTGVLQEAGAQDAATGTVRVLKYYCTYLDTTLQLEAIDANECTPGPGTFTFYRIGDGTNEYRQLVVGAGGDASITLPIGSYEVVEEETQSFFTVTVNVAETTQLLVGNPAVDVVPTEPPVTTGTVTVQNYYCTYIKDTLLVEAIDVNECSPGSATFSFYLVGDGTNDFKQIITHASGQGVIDLDVGSYEMVAEETQTHFSLNVLAGENVVLLIANPKVSAAPTAVPTAAPTVTPAPTKPPIKLPNTGAGVASDSGTLIVALTAAAAIAAGGALTVRKTRQG
jgi:hypothetical protein